MTVGQASTLDESVEVGVNRILVRAALVAAVMFAACLFGNFTRPVGHLSAFWPANALLLGMMIRQPRLVGPVGVLAAAAGYLAADLVAGGTLRQTVLLTLGNLSGVLAGHVILSRLAAEDRRLGRPISIPYFVLAAGFAAAVSGLVGGAINPILFNGGVVDGWTFWFVSELVNYVALLPVILTFPGSDWWHRVWSRGRGNLRLDQIAPVGTLLLSCAVGLLVGGPGAVAFPLPALLWCAFTFNLFMTSVLTLLFSVWTLLAISFDLLHLSLDNNAWPTVMSIRVGVTLMALAPITVGAVNAARDALLRSLQHMATHDQMTGSLNRAAFRDLASARLTRLAAAGRPAALLMIDIDHFKKINDSFGHAAGDRVLACFAQTARLHLREGDILGRLGGEEFAILLNDPSAEDAKAVAETIRSTFSASEIDLGDGIHITATVSIGLALAEQTVDLDAILLAADKSLYRAKRSGRNQTHISQADTSSGKVAAAPARHPTAA